MCSEAPSPYHFDCVTYQLGQVIIGSPLPDIAGDISPERSVFFNVPCHMDLSPDIHVVLFVKSVGFEQAPGQSLFEVIGKQKQQKVKLAFPGKVF